MHSDPDFKPTLAEVIWMLTIATISFLLGGLVYQPLGVSGLIALALVMKITNFGRV